MKKKIKIYKATFYSGNIETIEAEKETKCFLYIGGNRYSKDCDYYAFFVTFQEAKKAVIKKIENKISRIEQKLKKENEFLIKVKNKKKDDDNKQKRNDCRRSLYK